MSSHHSMSGSRTGKLDVSGSSGLQLSEIEAGDGGTRMPILSSSGSGYARTASNWVERLTFFLLLFVGVGIVVLIGVTSSTSKALTDYVNKKVASSSNGALGLPGYESLAWGDVVAKGVQGQVVNVYIDSGSLKVQRWMKYTAASQISKKYGIALNVVTTLSTAGIVQLIETEVAGGKVSSGGSVDIFWANGVNYKRARTGAVIPGVTAPTWGSADSGLGNLLYGPWANLVPSAAAYDWNTATIAFDMGTSNDGYEMPFFAANFNLIYRTDIVTTPPATFKDLLKLVNTPPSAGGLQGAFTYWNPSDYIAQAFIRHFLYEGCKTTLAGTVTSTAGYEAATTCSKNYQQYLSGYSSTLYNANVKYAFQQLQFLESGFNGASMPTNTKSNLQGNAYCTSESDCMGKFRAGTVYAVMEFSAPYAGANCASSGTGNTNWGSITVSTLPSGSVTLCDKTKAYVPSSTGAIANNNFMMIPKNAQNKMGAVAAGNWLGSIDAQYSRRYGSNADATCLTSDATCQNVNRWIGNFDITKPEYTGANGGPSWQTAYDYLTSYNNYPQTPDITSLRPPSALPELDPAYGLQMAADWVTCMGLTATGAAYSTTAPCA